MGLIGNGQIDLSTSVENEWLCSHILKAFGMAVAPCDIKNFEDQKVLVVRRFDRRFSEDGQSLIRLPQEDMCQVMGVSPDMKYESEGGPGIADIMEALLGSRNAEADRKSFFKAQVLFWMLAAIDGHAKNFSIFIEPRGRFVLTPLYDVLSAYPVMGPGAGKLPREKVRMAMAVQGKNRHYRWNSITRRHWLTTGSFCGLDENTVGEMLDELVETAPRVIEEVAGIIPTGFPALLAERILKGVVEAAARLQT